MSTPEVSPYHHGNLRGELLRRARASLPETGVEALSLRQLARDLGVSNAAPRRHFKDRASLLDALALAGFEELDANFAAISNSGNFRTDFHAVFEAYLRFAVGNSALLELMFARKYNDPAILEAVQKMMGRSVAIIEAGQARGEVKPGDPAAIGTASFAPVHGIAMLVGSGLLGHEQMLVVLDDALTIVVAGLRPR